MMLSLRKRSRFSCLALGWALSLTLFLPTDSRAQVLSGGSGAGTGTGSESGSQGGTTGTGNESGASNRLPGSDGFLDVNGGRNPQIPARDAIPFGGGISSSVPGENGLIPLDSLLTPGSPEGNEMPSSVSEVHLNYAKRIPIDGERSLALSRVASAATFSGQFDVADEALKFSAEAAKLMPPGLVRDQRLISIIAALMTLAEAHLREGQANSLALAPVDPKTDKAPDVDRGQLIRRAKNDWERAGELTSLINNPTYSNEIIYRVAESLAFGSQTIINEFPEPDDGKTKDPNGLNTSFAGLPDQLLVQAAQLTEKATRPVWHDRAIVAIATSAAESRQFARGIEIANTIPQPEVRTDALLKIAMTQARFGENKGATSTFALAAKSVASIPLDDPRAVLAGVLIDSLVSVGRFDDAIASVTLYPTEPKKWIALGAIAESQGRRGAAKEALTWINRDVPAAQRSLLYRRVNNGVVAAIEQNRNKVNSGDSALRERPISTP